MTPSRNGRCPCGSGLKYKRCCAAHPGSRAQKIHEFELYFATEPGLRERLSALDETSWAAACSALERLDDAIEAAGEAFFHAFPVDEAVPLRPPGAWLVGQMDAHAPVVDKPHRRWTAADHDLARANAIVDQCSRHLDELVGATPSEPDSRPLAPRSVAYYVICLTLYLDRIGVPAA